LGRWLHVLAGVMRLEGKDYLNVNELASRNPALATLINDLRAGVTLANQN
jgi:hypothetical protein